MSARRLAARSARGAGAEPVSLDGPYADYLTFLQTQSRVATLTLKHYRDDLRRLQRLLDGRQLAEMHRQDFRRLVAQLHAGGLGPRSIARTLSAWRGFYRWLVRYQGLPANPLQTVRAPRPPRLLPRALSMEQAAALLNKADEGPLDVRDKAMFELFYSSGLRLSELASLELNGGIDAEQGLVTVLGKGGKTRTVPVGRQALEALAAWVANRPAWARDPNQPSLFLSRTGERLKPGAIRARLARWARRAGLGVHVHPHILRHSFASHLLRSSGDLRAVQELLGHASIRSTQIYTHLDFDHLANVYDKAHPRARRVE